MPLLKYKTCNPIEPNPVQESVHDEFVKELVAAVQEFRLGHGTDPSTTHGPLIQPGAVDKVSECSDIRGDLVGRYLCQKKQRTWLNSGAPLRPQNRVQVEEKVQDALSKGATVQTGGKRPTFSENSPLNNGFFFEPTVISSTSVFVDGREL